MPFPAVVRPVEERRKEYRIKKHEIDITLLGLLALSFSIFALGYVRLRKK